MSSIRPRNWRRPMRKTHEEIEADTRAFEARGGKIKRVHAGATGIKSNLAPGDRLREPKYRRERDNG